MEKFGFRRDATELTRLATGQDHKDEFLFVAASDAGELTIVGYVRCDDATYTNAVVTRVSWTDLLDLYNQTHKAKEVL